MRHVAGIDELPDGGREVRFRNGDVARCPADDNVQHFRAGAPPRPTLDQVDPDRLYYDDPHCVGGLKYPFYFGTEPYRADRRSWWPDYLFRTIDLLVSTAGREVSIHGEVFSPWTQFMELFGYEQALIYALEDPAKCEAILAAYAEGAADLGVRQAQRGVDAVLISSAFAGAGFISPRMYDRFVLPYEASVVARIHAAGVPVYTHTCGDIGDRLERMADTGIDGIDTLDPPPLGSIDLADAKRRVGDRVFFKGNIDAVNTLLKKSRDEVRQDALQRLAMGSGGGHGSQGHGSQGQCSQGQGGYILSSACSVAPRVPPENLTVLVEAAEQFAAETAG
jgi:uroporphyrinogen-III decarboxylase